MINHIGNTTLTTSSGNISGVALVNVVKTLSGQVTGGILGNINTAALILAGAMISSVMITKYQKVQIEQIPEILKKK